jgi:cyclopropane-fatty-acyl-phospholipid synthase
MVVFQIQLARKNDTLPLTRGYIADNEQAIEKLEARAGTAAAAE